MSDFTNGFWPWYVAAISLVSIVACGILLWLAGKVTINTPPGQISDNTTGHVWDEDLRELNNPLPRWWMWLFVITVVFALAYLVVFPGLGSYKGLLNWSTDREHREDVSVLGQQVAPLYAEFAAQSVEALAKDARALAVGERVFMNNCSQCHGSDARGSKSYPNLANGEGAWLGERNAAHIVQTVTNGRTGMMPPMAAAIGGDQELSEVRIMSCHCPAAHTTVSRLTAARPDSRLALRVTVWMARVTKRSVHLILPTTTGFMAGARPRLSA